MFRAREAGTQRLVALKLLNVQDVSARALESFERESVALGALSAHPNIVTLYRSFSTPDGRPVLVLELCHGAVADRIRGGIGLPVTEAVSIAIKVSGALETAHRAEILHRDVKPQNILITEFGEPALADFGVAMLQSSSQTTAGLFDFTTLHAAPELLEGGPTSAATDVYELASTLYQLIAGRSAFRAYDGESPASVILRILRDPVRPVTAADVPTQLSDLLIWAMSKEKDNRPPSAAEFAAELSAVEVAQGWPRTPFLIRDSGWSGSLPTISRMPEAEYASTAAARELIDIGQPSTVRGPSISVPRRPPGPAHRAGGAPVKPKAPAPPVPPARPQLPPDSGELWSLCPQGHLVVRTVKFCPVCGAAVIHQRPADVVQSTVLGPEPFHPLHIAQSSREVSPDEILDADPAVLDAAGLGALDDADVAGAVLPDSAGARMTALSRDSTQAALPAEPGSSAGLATDTADDDADEGWSTVTQTTFSYLRIETERAEAERVETERVETERVEVERAEPDVADAADPSTDSVREVEPEARRLSVDDGRLPDAAGAPPTLFGSAGGAIKGSSARAGELPDDAPAAPPVDKLVVRGWPARGTGIVAGTIAVLVLVVVAAGAVVAVSLVTPAAVRLVVGAGAVIVVIVLAWAVARLARPTLIADQWQASTRSGFSSTRVPWAAVTGIEAVFRESGNDGHLVLHTAGGVVPLPATRSQVRRLRELHGQLDGFRNRTASVGRR
ncbi:MAG: protein kinase [Actinobacteria bacterium]|nr:protein kinase [Actinomycetota bacterium]